MPEIVVSSKGRPPSQLLEAIASSVATQLQISPARVWVFWNELTKGSCQAVPWKEDGHGGAVVKMRCKSVYPEHQVQGVLKEISQLIIDYLKISNDSLLAIVDRVNAGQVFAEGKLWDGPMCEPVMLIPVAIVKNDRNELTDDHWGTVVSKIEMDSSRFSDQSLQGLRDFSHLEVIFLLHKVPPDKIITTSRRPRNLAHLPEIGIFAQRPKARPNRIGLSVCRIVSIEGTTIEVEGLDAINESPVLDIKPYFNEFAPRGIVSQPDWVSEITKNYY